MREILFRGKSTSILSTDTWLYGSYIKQKHPSIRILDDGVGFNLVELPIDPKTVGEYTGLEDKGGTKIFEGDILKIAKTTDGYGFYFHPPLPYPVNVVVKWDLCAWMWETLGEDKYYITFPNAWCHYECEIIGNIYDNPELLKGEK